MRRVLTALFATALSLGAARADVGIILVFQGDNDVHKQCDLGLGFETFGTDYAKIRFEYAIFVQKRPVANCLAVWSSGDRMIDTNCTGISNLAYRCTEITKIRPKGIDCLDAGGKLVGCGTLKIGGEKIFTFK